jgi:hypothetical protein
LVQSAFFAAPAVLATPLLPKGVEKVKVDNWLSTSGKRNKMGFGRR